MTVESARRPPSSVWKLGAPLVLALVLGILLSAGCRREVRVAPEAWQRVDLWSRAPQVLVAPGGTPADHPGPAFRSRHAYLGRHHDLGEGGGEGEGRKRRRRGRGTHWSAGRVRALEQSGGSTLAWNLDLGAEPYLSFVPLRHPKRPCGCEIAVYVTTDEGRRELLRRPAASGAVSSRVEELSLSPYAGQRARLELVVDEVAGEGSRPPGAVLWGSPAVYSRGEVRQTWAGPATATGVAPNVILVGIDTLRADALGAYGRDPSLTPALDRLAEESDVWLEAYTSFNVTNPSFASLMTGLYGKNHGVYDLQTPLPGSAVTLAEQFQNAGYGTLAVISAAHLAPTYSGLGQGFDYMVGPQGHAAAEQAVDQAMDWIDDQRRPFFLWLHLFDPHTPHTPPKPYAAGRRPEAPTGLAPTGRWVPFRPPGAREYAYPQLGGHADLYAGEVAYLDRQLDRLFGFLASRGLLERSLLVVVADHGENLDDHGVRFRHTGLWETTTRVPLMIRWPAPSSGARPLGRRLSGLVQHLDLFPTLLAAAGLPVPEQDGVDLRRMTGDAGTQGRPEIFAEHAHRQGTMIRRGSYKYFRLAGTSFAAEGTYLYDLEADPQEETNLAGSGLEVEGELARRLEAWLEDSRAPRPSSVDLSPEERRRLEALGYL